MSDHNLRILTRNLRRERDRAIVYNNRASSWKTIFKHHPLESKENESLFYNMEHCKEYLGAEDNIIVLRTAYTWTNLQKIAENSMLDCLTFYEVAKHTFLSKKGLLDNSTHLWFKKALTALYLSRDNAPESLNFLSDLNQEQKEQSLALSFQSFGINSLPKYEKYKKALNIENFNEKLLFWYWNVDARSNNLIDQVIDKLGKNKKVAFDHEYLAEYFQPKNLLKYQSEEINKRFVPFKDIIVETKRYAVKNQKLYCLMNEEIEKISLKNIYDLFCCQSLIKQFQKKWENENSDIVLMGDVKETNFASFLGEFKYSSLPEIFNDYPLTKESHKSMEEFIELNLSKAKDNAEQSYWNKVQTIFLACILNNDLNINDKNNNKKPKI
jgi:hypothetical protein